MSDYRDQLEQESRRFAMPDDAFDRLVERRSRRHRNRRIAAAVVALVVTAGGAGGGVYALRSGGSTQPVAPTPTPSIGPIVSPAPSETSTPPSPSASPSQPLGPLGTAPAVSGPIEFLDEQTGWMVDENGQIMATHDGGHSWDPQLSEPSTVTAIDFVDLMNGWAIFDGGLLRTTDGGKTWDTSSTVRLLTVQFLTPESGWGVQAMDASQPTLGRLVRTDDGGATWNEPSQILEVNSVCFGDQTHGWAAGPSEGGVSLFQTVDGGAGWTETGIGLQGGDQVGYVATVRCGGIDAWVLAAGGAAAGHVGYALFATNEGGPDVRPVLQEPYTHPLGQGQNIPEATNPYPGPLAAFDGLRADLVTWCPPCGGDLPYVSLEWSDDGGATWADPTIVGSNKPGEPLGISFLDQSRGWILLRELQTGTARVVMRTTDGGQTWETP